jgi:preprotein translocase subunit SecF
MQFIKDDININFIGNRRKAYIFSLILITLTVLLLFYRGGLKLGVDFAGGIRMQVKMTSPHPPAEIMAAMKPIDLQDSIVQEFGEKDQNEYHIMVQNPDIKSEGLGDKVVKVLKDKFGESVEMRNFEHVGPKVGSDLTDKASLALLITILLVSIYISGRFELQWTKSIIMTVALCFVVFLASKLGVSKVWLSVIAVVVSLVLLWALKLNYALGAVVALVHDVVIVIGAFALMDKEVSLAIVAALLTIIGYSLNDTIVIFDRIRENNTRYKKRDLAEIMNISINQTLGRTIITAGTVFLVVVALYLWGGSVIHDFAFAMLIGTIEGVYSTVYIASPIILLFEGKADKKK